MKNKYILTGHDILTLDVSKIHVPPNYILRCVLNLMVILTFYLKYLRNTPRSYHRTFSWTSMQGCRSFMFYLFSAHVFKTPLLLNMYFPFPFIQPTCEIQRPRDTGSQLWNSVKVAKGIYCSFFFVFVFFSLGFFFGTIILQLINLI